MRTHTIPEVMFRHVAVPAQNLQVCGELVAQSVPPYIARAGYCCAFHVAVIVRVIQGEERSTRLTATHTFVPVVGKHGQPLLSVRPSNPVKIPSLVIYSPLGCTFATVSAFGLLAVARSTASTQPTRVACTFSPSPLLGTIKALPLTVWGSFARARAAHTLCFTPVTPFLGLLFTQVHNNIVPDYQSATGNVRAALMAVEMKLLAQ